MAFNPEDLPAVHTGRRRLAPGLGWGLLAGFVAGVPFIALNAWFSSAMGKPQLTPFRVVATVVQGPPPPHATIWIGMVIHSVLAALFGVVFAAVVVSVPRVPPGALMWAGLIYGGLIYIVDFQVLARVVHQFSAFRGTKQPLELAAHLVFGAVLAALLAARPSAPRRSESAA